MREIKFRAWDKDFKKMHPVIGIHWAGEFIDYGDEGETGNLADFILMQYTGFSVKGKEIYDGDILSKKWAVEWDNERGFWVVFNPNKHYCALGEALYNVPELEVVGNIYENIELWEMDKDE
jgi:hypothetical protein